MSFSDKASVKQVDYHALMQGNAALEVQIVEVSVSNGVDVDLVNNGIVSEPIGDYFFQFWKSKHQNRKSVCRKNINGIGNRIRTAKIP